MRHAQLQTILRELTAGFRAILGDQFQEAYLYGSQARGEARSDSDIDVLVVVSRIDDYETLITQTSNFVSRLSLKYDVVVSRTFVTSTELAETQSPFYLNVRRESVAI